MYDDNKQWKTIGMPSQISDIYLGEWKNGKKASTVVVDAHNRWQERQVKV